MKNIPNDIIELSQHFTANGFELMVVGGAVRDSILGIQPKDWDLATNAHPDKIIQLLRQMDDVTNILEIGKQFGIVVAVMNGVEYEIARYRSDSSYSDSRRPDKVQFSTIEQDCLRRDLTMNALYFDIKEDKLIDMVGGIDDIENCIIKTVGKPQDRFSEDPLRKLRCLRFAIRFNTELSEDIKEALINDGSLDGVSPERIRKEFKSTLETKGDINRYFELLDEFGFTKIMFPRIFTNTSTYTVRGNYIVNLALLVSINTTQTIKEELNTLTYSTQEIKDVVFLNRVINMKIDDIDIIKKLQKGTTVSKLDLMVYAEKSDVNLSFMVSDVWDFELSVKGGDIIKEGVKPGPQVGMIVKKREIENFNKFCGW